MFFCWSFNLVWIEIKYLEMQYFWTKNEFPMSWDGFATGFGSISSKGLWIRIQQNDTDPDPKKWYRTGRIRNRNPALWLSIMYIFCCIAISLHKSARIKRTITIFIRFWWCNTSSDQYICNTIYVEYSSNTIYHSLELAGK